MTDTPQQQPDANPPAADAPPADADAPRRSRWNVLNRTGKAGTGILAVAAAAVLAVGIFGAGVLLGAELGDEGDGEGHHRQETSEHHGESDDGEESDESSSEGDGQDQSDNQESEDGSGENGADGENGENGGQGADGDGAR